MLYGTEASGSHSNKPFLFSHNKMPFNTSRFTPQPNPRTADGLPLLPVVTFPFVVITSNLPRVPAPSDRPPLPGSKVCRGCRPLHHCLGRPTITPAHGPAMAALAPGANAKWTWGWLLLAQQPANVSGQRPLFYGATAGTPTICTSLPTKGCLCAV